MAKASKETIVIRPAQAEITEDIITLQLSKEEAIALITVLDVVGGDGRCSDRQYIDNIYIALDSAAVRYDENALDRNYKPVVRFRDWSEYKEAIPDDNVAEKQEFKFKIGERVYIPEWMVYGKITDIARNGWAGDVRYSVLLGLDEYIFIESSLQHVSQPD